jgi:choline dehydrogenase-like flavoprotein
MNEAWDYIIVGGGSAGCVLANRLSADPAKRVLLLEAGGENRSPFVTMPKGFAKTLVDPAYLWSYPARPHHGGGNEPLTWIGGRGLGGGSSVNGMLYVRGQPQDYEAWARMAGPEWGWAKMKTAFRAIEDHELGDDGNRGVGGPIGISVNGVRDRMTERFIEAGVQMGIPRREDLNGEDQEGVGYYAQNIRRGRRVTAAEGFLKPARRRRNLTVLTGVEAGRIGFEGKRAARVFARRGGESVSYESRGEIIVSCGTVGSPLMLQRSGIGPAELLTRCGVPVVADLPVGRRLREQFVLAFTRALVGEKGQAHLYQGLGLFRSLLEFGLLGRGVLANCVWDVGLFARSSAARDRPDLQLEIGAVMQGPPVMRNGKPVRLGMSKTPGVTCYSYMNQPESEGVVEISAAEPGAPPVIETNFLSTPQDERMGIDTVRFTRRWFEQPALRPFVGEEITPGGGDSDEEILTTLRRHGFAGVHPVGTCRMGAGAESVVDERLRVRGVEGLRVADCSVMPSLVSGNTNGPAMALGWRAADLILQTV